MSQNTDKMLKLALVFFISLLSFSIGTFVGKKYSDNQHKLAQLEPQKNKEITEHDFAASADGEKSEVTAGKDGADPLLTDNEVAKIAEEFATETEADTKMEKSVNPPTTMNSAAPTTSAISATSDEKEIREITATARPTIQPKPLPAATLKTAPAKTAAATTTAAPTSAPAAATPAREVASLPASTMGQYTVQVGSFPTQAEAQKLSQDLMNKGYKSSSIPAQINGQTWHRVQVGLFGTVKEAQNYKKDFLEKTKLTAAIVQRVK